MDIERAYWNDQIWDRLDKRFVMRQEHIDLQHDVSELRSDLRTTQGMVTALNFKLAWMLGIGALLVFEIPLAVALVAAHKLG